MIGFCRILCETAASLPTAADQRTKDESWLWLKGIRQGRVKPATIPDPTSDPSHNPRRQVHTSVACVQLAGLSGVLDPRDDPWQNHSMGLFPRILGLSYLLWGWGSMDRATPSQRAGPGFGQRVAGVMNSGKHERRCSVLHVAGIGFPHPSDDPNPI